MYPRVPLAAPIKTKKRVLKCCDQESGCLLFYLPAVHSNSFVLLWMIIYRLPCWINVNALSWGFRRICSSAAKTSNKICRQSVKSKFLAAALERQNQLASEYIIFSCNFWRRWPKNIENTPTCSSRGANWDGEEGFTMQSSGERLYTFSFTTLLMFVLLY